MDKHRERMALLITGWVIAPLLIGWFAYHEGKASAQELSAPVPELRRAGATITVAPAQAQQATWLVIETSNATIQLIISEPGALTHRRIETKEVIDRFQSR